MLLPWGALAVVVESPQDVECNAAAEDLQRKTRPLPKGLKWAWEPGCGNAQKMRTRNSALAVNLPICTNCRLCCVDALWLC